MADGINKAHGVLNDLGMIGEASIGRGFSDLSLTGMQLGHEGLAAGFEAFCERRVRALHPNSLPDVHCGRKPEMGELMPEGESAIHIAPWMHVITAGGSVGLDELLPTSGSVYVARLNGLDMTYEISTFQQFDELLKFPEYFGWNWNAFYDCLRDLRWLSSDHRVLIVDAAESALSEDAVAREEFFRSLWRAGRRWSYTKRPEGVTLSKFFVVLSCGKKSASDLVRQIESLEAPPLS